MEPITIAALIAAIAGAGMQYKATSDANKRQNESIRQGLERQRELQLEAESKAMTKAQEFNPGDRQQAQSELADQISKELAAPVSESQAIRAQEQATTGDVSQDYAAAKTKSDLVALKGAQELARLMGKSASSGRLRLNEGIGLMDTGQQIDQLGSFSRGNQAADQIAIQQAGRVDPGQVFLGSLLQTAGTAGLMSGSGGVEKLTVNEGPTLAGSPGMAPVYDLGGGNPWLKAINRLKGGG